LFKRFQIVRRKAIPEFGRGMVWHGEGNNIKGAEALVCVRFVRYGRIEELWFTPGDLEKVEV
jgi:hypothetical protein